MLDIRLPATIARDAIKAAGGAEYEALLAREREARARFRARHPEMLREYYRRKRKSLKSALVGRAKRRGRKAGLEATITVADLVWPTHCPVLGFELDYSTPCGSRVFDNPANPSLDRWDNTKGYVPGNVFVISARANALKNDGTYEEFVKILAYVARPPGQ